MRQPADRHQRDECARLRSRIDALRRETDDAVEHIGADADLLCPREPLCPEHTECDGHTARGRSRDAGHDVRCDDGAHERAVTDGEAEQCLLDDGKCGQRGDNAAIRIARGDVEDGRGRTDGARVDRIRQPALEAQAFAPDDGGGDGREEEGDVDRPDCLYLVDAARHEAELHREQALKAVRRPRIRPRPVKRIADDEVEYNDHDERECREPPVGQSLCRFLRLVEDVLSIALAFGIERALAIADPPPRNEEVEDGADDAEDGSRPCSRAEERRRDNVLDLRCAGDGDHTVGEDAHPEQPRQKLFRDVRLTKEDRRKRIHDERHHKYRESAVRQYSAANEHGENGLVLPERLDDLIRNGGSKPALLHDLCKDRTEEEDGIVGLNVLRRLGHIDLAVDGHERVPAAESCDDGKERRDEDDGVAAVGKDHEQDEADEDHGEFHATSPFIRS